MMIGIDILNVVFDASGSFREPGKQHLLNYIGNTAMNLELLPQMTTKFAYYTWRDEIRKADDVENISAFGKSNVESLRRFLLARAENEAVILITDGNFFGMETRAFRDAVTSLGNRFAVAAAGFDAAEFRLRALTPQFFYAEDVVAAFKLLAG